MPTAVQSLALAFGLGAAVTAICHRLKFPAILPLLLMGFVVGRSGLNLVDADTLESGLLGFISVAIALLIFEGSLHLDRETLARAPKAVPGLLTIGAGVTWLGCTALAWAILDMRIDVALLLGATLIVTGPTVIQPILRRVPLKQSLHAALMAEGILIDPIGVVAAVATLELVRAQLDQSGSHGIIGTAWLYGEPLITGIVVGGITGLIGSVIIKRTIAKGREHVVNIIGMGVCMIAVGVAESRAHEAGLVAAAACGVVIANARTPAANELRHFKEQISTLLVGAVFILLASRIDIDRIRDVTLAQVLFALGLILLIRPAAVFIATFRSALSVREQLFTAFLGPRGIVAASLGSIIAIELADAGRRRLEASPDAAVEAEQITRQGALLESTVMLVIFITVALTGILAGPVATLLRVRAGKPGGVLIVGAHLLGRDIALALKEHKIPVKLVDRNVGNITAAREHGIDAIAGDATDSAWLEEAVLNPQIGWLLAITDNADVDSYLCRWGVERFGPGQAFRWFRRKPEESDPAKRTIGVALQWGRPIRHLLFQYDMDLAHVESWKSLPEGGVPLAVIDQDGRLTLVSGDAPAESLPAGATIIGVRIGPAKKESQTESPAEGTPSDAT